MTKSKNISSVFNKLLTKCGEDAVRLVYKSVTSLPRDMVWGEITFEHQESQATTKDFVFDSVTLLTTSND